MKKLSYLALSLVTICLFSCGNKSAADQAHVDSLETSLVESTADNQQLNEFLTVVATALDSIEMQETQLYNTGSESPVPNQAKIKSQLSHLKETLKSQRERIGQLEKQMKLDADNAKKLQRVVTALKNQLTDKEKQIASLEEEIADKNITIDGLRNYMSQLRQQNTQQQEVIESQSQTMQAQDQQLNEAYIIMATKSALKDAGLLKGGFLKKSKIDINSIDKNLAMTIDIRKTTEINIDSKHVKVLSQMPTDAYTIENIKTYALKKYKTNLLAGRRDSALVVSRQICDSLEHAFNLAKKLDAEEQIVIIDKIEQLTQQDADNARQKQLGLFGLLGLLFLCFIGYAIYRGRKIRKLHAAHKELKADYGELESRTADKERTQTLQRTALDCQKALLPFSLPKRKDLTVLASLTPGQTLSSDLYDYLIRDEKLFFCIGSAQGATIQSSVQMAMTWSQFRATATIASTSSQILAAINSSLAATNGPAPAIDLFVGVLHLTTGHLNYALAGNISPLLLQNEEVTLLPIETTVPAGASADTTYPALQTEIAAGAMLFLYTDGIAKVTKADGKILGEKRLRGAVLQALKINANPAAFIESLSASIQKFTDAAPQAADQTMLLISRN